METTASTIFYVKAQVGGSFNASVKLRASSPTLPNSAFTFSPEHLNFPYTDSSALSVVTTGAHEAGNHLIIVEGYNGPMSVRDTVTISVKPRPAWRVYDTSNSPLPTNMIRTVAVDKNGVAWIGTGRGLVRFDGVNWTVFGDTSNGEGRAVHAVCVDDSGSVFTNGYFTLEKYKDDEWKSFQTAFYFQDLATGTDNVVWSSSHLGLTHHVDSISTYFVAEDPNLDLYPTHHAVDNANAVWVVGGDGVVRFDGTYWTRYSPEELGLGSDMGSPRVYRGVNDTMYVAASGNIITFSGGTHNVTQSDSKNLQFPGPRPGRLAVDSLGTKWIATGPAYHDQHEGLGRLKDGQWSSYNVGNSGLPSNTIYDMVADNYNTLWICTDKGLATLNTALDPLIAFSTSVNGGATSNSGKSSLISAISPNPTSDVTGITLNIVSNISVRVAVINALGQEVIAVFEGMPTVTSTSFAVNTSMLPAGVYYVQVASDNVVEAKQLLITR